MDNIDKFHTRKFGYDVQTWYTNSTDDFSFV
jgi:hypothetical protein